ncbi:GFA family protein [Pleomorphomonas sp. JP5]|uniref:GFA family protein n=1 Tax=Pleomorphomonas sp. JP5 TaxID=2942998 RepID=UPI002042E78A|nr:GFA family protein [Pleomorphomonas sp. JP5]MCM5557627.1 GFA family protein [Pleomorphomonas sp. JP5]
MPAITSGSCQCGAVQFQVSGEFEAFFLCHCQRCRKDTGSAHAANLFSATAKLNWVSGRESIRSYRVPESRHEKSFCVTCGSAVPTVSAEGSLLVVPAGSLDSTIDIRPNAHICCSSRAEWDEGLETIPKLDGLPG